MIVYKIWLLGAALSLAVFGAGYIRSAYRLRRCSHIQGHHNATIYTVPGCAVPMSAGIFRRKILLPPQNYTEKERHYILCHEYTHFAHHDHLIKMLAQIFCCLFWWNPLAYLLRREISQRLELRCDKAMTQNMVNGEKEEYLTVLLRLVKDSGGNPSMEERFRRIAGLRPRLRRGHAAGLAAAFVLVCMGPTLPYMMGPGPEIREITTPAGRYEIVIRGDTDAWPQDMEVSTNVSHSFPPEFSMANGDGGQYRVTVVKRNPEGGVPIEVCIAKEGE